MALSDLMALNSTSFNNRKVGLSEERIRAVMPQLRQYISFWREYPDLMVDFMLEHGGNPQNFQFFFY